MSFSAKFSSANVSSSGISARVDLSSYTGVANSGDVLKIANTGTESIAFQQVGASGTTTLGGVGIMVLGPGEVDEMDFDSSNPHLAHICTSSGTFNVCLGSRVENTK